MLTILCSNVGSIGKRVCSAIGKGVIKLHALGG